MPHLAATFANHDDAVLARQRLIQAGVPAEGVVLSRPLTEDPIAAEWPGQSYENQDYRSSDQIRVAPGTTDTDRARYNEEMRTAACVLTVRLHAAKECETVSRLLREQGAKSVVRAAI